MTKKLYRSRKDRMLTGVSGGIANYLGWNSNIVRVLLVILAFTDLTFTSIGDINITSGLLVTVVYAVLAYTLKDG